MEILLRKTKIAQGLLSGGVVLITALLAACGGGSGSEVSTSLPATSDAGSGSTGSPATIILTNLPAKQTNSVSAAIGYEVGGSAASYTVYCRLDSYAPIVCPDQFLLGQSNGLSAGAHTVDYFVDSGSGIDVANPTSSYSWTVAAAGTPTTPAPTTPVAPTPTSPDTSTATPLAALSTSTASKIVSSGGSISSAADPKGSGKTVSLTRITNGGSMIYGGVRAEQAWNGAQLVPGRDYWMAFAVMIKPGEEIPTVGGSDDEMLVFQTHTPAQGATNPDISLCFQGQTKSLRWRSAYNSKPSNTWSYNGGSNPDTEAETTRYTEALPTAGVWTRFIVHYRPGYTTAQNPRLRVWRATAGGSYAQLFDSPALNTYNSLAGPSYPRIGPYKWSDSAWNSSSQAFYLSSLFFGEGSDLLESAKASLAGF